MERQRASAIISSAGLSAYSEGLAVCTRRWVIAMIRDSGIFQRASYIDERGLRLTGVGKFREIDERHQT